MSKLSVCRNTVDDWIAKFCIHCAVNERMIESQRIKDILTKRAAKQDNTLNEEKL
jgi:hypothetical protein